MTGPTLIRAPPKDSSKSLMENVLELKTLSDIEPDLFTNTRELWHPPGARGVYGGAVIAQCLAAAFKTLPCSATADGNAAFLPHSMHCYFVLAGNSSIPILYHVERVREGRSFLTRTVQARQRGKCIFTTTISFMKEGSNGDKHVEHGWDMPANALQGLQDILQEEKKMASNTPEAEGIQASGPFISKRLAIAHSDAPFPHLRRPQSWLRCRGQLSPDVPSHLTALAYMSDSWFIGTVSRIHQLDRFSKSRSSADPYLRRLAIFENAENKLKEEHRNRSKTGEIGQTINTPSKQPDAAIGMMVSLDHTIYFHRPREVRADDWLCSEMESPWSGEGRGLVMQRIWNKEGRLVATCIQEGLVRLDQGDTLSRDSKL